MNSNAKILIIEDDDVLRGTLAKVLQKEGYVVDQAASGPEALEITKNKQYDLIVADVRLPGGIDGIEVIKKVKEDPVYSHIKVIIITGYADIDAPVRAIKIKVDDFLWKPFKLSDFMDIIKYNIKTLLDERESDKNNPSH